MTSSSNQIDEKYAPKLQTGTPRQGYPVPEWYENVDIQLHEIENECSDHGWDGYNATPIPKKLIILSRQLTDKISTLNLGVIENVSPGPQEEIIFEFVAEEGYTKIMTLRSDGKLLCINHKNDGSNNHDEIETYEGPFSGLTIPQKAHRFLKP